MSLFQRLSVNSAAINTASDGEVPPTGLRPFVDQDRPTEQSVTTLVFAVVTGAAFGLYWLSSFILHSRNAISHFGGDAHLYVQIADGVAMDWLTRFHPLTVAMAVAWLKVLSPVVDWAPQHLLKAMYAAIGAVGVWASMSAFGALIPRRYAVLFGSIYAVSLGVWYYSSIDESKIITTTLTALYIATYLKLRIRWSPLGALLLTAILLLACLNEIVCGFLVIIPMVDFVMQPSWKLRDSWWIAAHALAGPLALLILEVVVNGWLIPPETAPERASHVSMLLYYLASNDYSPANLYAFAVNWLFFNIAAPSTDASYNAMPALNFSGDFEPDLASYCSSPLTIGLVALAGAIVVASILPRHRPHVRRDLTGLVLGLAVYAILRAAFFLIYLPGEPLLNSSAVTLAHLLMISIPFATSGFPAKEIMLATFAVLLFIVNGAFIMGL
jgi:hypothetical protein